MNRTKIAALSGLLVVPAAALAVLLGANSAPAAPAPAPAPVTSTVDVQLADCAAALNPTCMAHVR